eukprot:6694-Pleurochrysis_carterae.AAC.1
MHEYSFPVAKHGVSLSQDNRNRSHATIKKTRSLTSVLCDIEPTEKRSTETRSIPFTSRVPHHCGASSVNTTTHAGSPTGRTDTRIALSQYGQRAAHASRLDARRLVQIKRRGRPDRFLA